MPEQNELILKITYNHTLGNFECELPNRVRFRFERSECQGRLRNNLDLYRAAIIAQLPEPHMPRQTKAQIRREAAALSEGVPVSEYTFVKKERASRVMVELSLEELGL